MAEAQQILSAGLGADMYFAGENRQRQFPLHAGFADLQHHPALLVHGVQKLTENLTVQGMKQIVVFKPEFTILFRKPVQQERANHTQRRNLGKVIQCIRPGVQRNLIAVSGIQVLLSLPANLNQSQLFIFLYCCISTTKYNGVSIIPNMIRLRTKGLPLSVW